MRRRKTLVIEYPASMLTFPTRLYSSDPRAKMTIEKLDNLCKNETLKIIEANHDDEALGKNVSIQLDLDEHLSSSEHVVIFGIMEFLSCQSKIPICVKFLKNSSHEPEENEEKLDLVHFFTQKNANAVVFNYNQADYWAKEFNANRTNHKVCMNNVYVCESSEYLFWVERRLDNFVRFWDDIQVKYIDKLISTRQQALFELQKFIYVRSGYQFTIIDLQGTIEVEVSQENIEKINYILSDVEFTTSNLYEFTPTMLMEEFVRLNNLERVNLHDLNVKFNTLNENFNTLNENFNTLNENFNTLNEKFNTLEHDLNDKFNILNEKFNNLIQAVNNLKK
jgi:hypothetical protein